MRRRFFSTHFHPPTSILFIIPSLPLPQIFVERLRWLTAPVFTELFALSQCIPGPSSTQMAYSIGIIKKGPAGGLLSGLLCFQLPGAVLMALVGLGVARWLADPAPWLRGITTGLGAAGVALIAVSGVALSTSCCKDRWTAAATTVTAIATFYYSAIWLMPVLILAGGLLTLAAYWRRDLSVASEDKHVESYGLPRWAGAVVVALWIAVLAAGLLAKRFISPSPLPLQWWNAWYTAGSLIFGGGQVVVPLLYGVVVQQDCKQVGLGPGGTAPFKSDCTDKPTSWVTTSDFYTGLAVIQAAPGPMFNFAAYLGAIMAKRAGIFPLVGILLGLLGLNAPGLLLLYGILPFWGRFRHWAPYRRALPGLNASAVGLVVSAAVRLALDVRSKAPWPDAASGIMMLAFAATHVFKVTPPLVVGGGGVLGAIAWAAKMK